MMIGYYMDCLDFLTCGLGLVTTCQMLNVKSITQLQ